ncbi:MAG: hypothetical protein AAGF49_14975 [Pseudomonadota bacterium]
MRNFMMYAAMIVVAMTATAAQARPDTRQMSCNQVQSLIDRQGSVVMTTGPRTFKKFVRRDNQCMPGQVLRVYLVPTNDFEECGVWGVCQADPFARRR